MHREEFFAKLAPLDEGALKKALWNLYWRGSAQVRERIECELEPAEQDRRRRAATQLRDPALVLSEVRGFAGLARSGAYLGGTREVSPKERSRWRLTFRRLAADAQAALRAPESGQAEDALTELIDLACETRDADYFRTEDPMEAARFVVSDAAGLLWGTLLERYGFAGFAERAAPQFVRWESRFGWSRSGWGQLAQRETSLASVLTSMLRTHDMWTGFAVRYLDALDEGARRDATRKDAVWFGFESGSGRNWRRDKRAADLAEWHLQLLDRLDDPETGDLLARLVAHPALEGPELTLLQARLARRRDDVAHARALVRKVLEELPGHQEALAFAQEIAAPLPSAAARIAMERSE